MKPETAPRGQAESPARVEFQVRFSLATRGQRRVSEAQVEPTPPKVAAPAPKPKAVATAEPVSKVTRLLLLAHHFERLVRDGAVKDYAEIARLAGLTRARVTQIVNLTLLAPGIQEAILNPSRNSRIAERNVRPVAALVDWKQQWEKWHSLVPASGVPAAASPRSVHPR